MKLKQSSSAFAEALTLNVSDFKAWKGEDIQKNGANMQDAPASQVAHHIVGKLRKSRPRVKVKVLSV